MGNSHTKSGTEPIVIGVGGASGSGKSTVCKAIRARLEVDCDIICLDRYFMWGALPHHPKHGQNWETYCGVNWTGLRKALSKCKDSAKARGCPIAIVEGKSQLNTTFK